MKTEEFDYQCERLEIMLEYLRDEIGAKQVENFIKGGEIESTKKRVNTIAREARTLFRRLGDVDVLWDGINYTIIKNQLKQAI